MYDILTDYKDPRPGEGPFFTEYLYQLLEDDENAGLSSCDWDETKYPYLCEHKDILIARFKEKYMFREIGQETPVRWQLFVNARFNEVAEKYNHSYKVFKENNVDEIGTGYTMTEELDRTNTSKMDSTNNFSTTEKYKDTPISGSIGNPTSETTQDSDTTYGSSGTDTQKDSKTTTKTQHDDVRMKELNYLSDYYKTINNEFLKEFENQFMGLYMSVI